jgi:hypothetical protein
MNDGAWKIIIAIVAVFLVFPAFVAAAVLKIIQGTLLFLCAGLIVGLLFVCAYFLFFNQNQRDRKSVV